MAEEDKAEDEEDFNSVPARPPRPRTCGRLVAGADDVGNERS